jgi:peptidyl-prolyl cis-trans isomerase C
MIMRKNMHVLAALVFAAASALAADQPLVTGAPAAPPKTAPTAETKPVDLFGDRVIARGKGCEVKRSQLDDVMTTIRSTAAARGQMIPPEQGAMIERMQLDQLIQVQLLNAMATPADKAKGEENANKQFDTMKTRAGNEESLNRQLKGVGMTQESLKARMIELAIAEAVLDRELNVTISDEEVKKYYDENPKKFEQPEMVRAAHILLSTRDGATELTEEKKAAKRKLAEDLLKRARAGEDFAKMAKEYSEDPGSKDTGGEYTFPKGQMLPEFEAAAWALNTNQISDIVTTMYGYHIIKLLERMPAKKADLDKVSTTLREQLKQRAMGQKMPEYTAKLKKDANVEILDEKLKLKPEDLQPPAGAPSNASVPPTGNK